MPVFVQSNRHTFDLGRARDYCIATPEFISYIALVAGDYVKYFCRSPCLWTLRRTTFYKSRVCGLRLEVPGNQVGAD